MGARLAIEDSVDYATYNGVVGSKMLAINTCDNSRCRRWAAIVVLVAVCALTVRVATRYAFSHATSESAKVSLHKQAAPGRQRLLKNAASWTPPVICLAILDAPSSYPRTAPAGPPVPGLLLEETLYNRPPPGFLSL